MTLPYNKVSVLSDWTDLRDEMRTVYAHHAAHSETWPQGAEYRKDWEVVQCVRGLRAFGALGPKSRVLGVGAGHEHTLYYLTTVCGEVHATDLYESGGWPGWADRDMLVNPGAFAQTGATWEPQHLVVQHMDGRALRYPDGSFNGVFSSSSIEHFGSLDEIAGAASEMGRVLKPGGVLALTTEFRLGGRDGDGWPGVVLFNEDTLRQYLIEPSGCVLVDEPDYTVDKATLRTQQNLDWVIAIQSKGEITPTPHIVLEFGGFIFASVSVVLRKPKK